MVMVNALVTACVELYKKLAKTGKPKPNEWTVISAVVAVFDNKDIKVISLGTGSKCIGKNSLSSNGDVLNDFHAEVIARRAFLKFLFLEIVELNTIGFSRVLSYSESENFFVKDSVKFYFVTSMSPCGDASIMPKAVTCFENEESLKSCFENTSSETTNKKLKRVCSSKEIEIKKLKLDPAYEEDEKLKEDIHRTGAKCLPESEIQDPHLPGVFYHNIGVVRTKPGRGDPTLSMSCSDKIARWNAVGWQSALLSFFINNPIYVEAIIVGGSVPFSKASLDRALNERIFRKNFVPIYQSDVTFPDIKAELKRPNPSSIIWCCSEENQTEVSVNGRKLGVTKKNLNKKSARSSICKKEMFALFGRAINSFRCKDKFIENILTNSGKDSLEEMTYGELKAAAINYQNRWKDVKKNCFKIWSNKPENLLNFTLKEATK